MTHGSLTAVLPAGEWRGDSWRDGKLFPTSRAVEGTGNVYPLHRFTDHWSRQGGFVKFTAGLCRVGYAAL